MKISKGYLQALCAYFAWGIFPIYWKFLSHISTFEVLSHRIIWSFFFFFLIVLLSKKIQFGPTLSLLKKNTLVVFSLALLVSTNWCIYVYAVNSGYILQGSLAYFITPIMNIVLGAWIFKERLSRGMKVAAGVASFGVLILIFLNSTFPWIALSLALTFGIYGIIKKKTHIGGIESSLLENSVMLVPAIVAGIYWRGQQIIPLTSVDCFFLIGGGFVTAIPILLFSLSTRAVPLNHTGILQFLAPTMQFLIGSIMYKEPVSQAKLLAFVFVWIGVGLYMRELLSKSRKNLN